MKQAFFLLAALVAASLSLGVPGAEGALRVGENYRLNSMDPADFRGKDAVALAVNPGNPRNIVELNSDWLPGDCEYTASFDGGDTWTAGAPFKTPEGFQETCKVGGHLAQPIDRGLAYGSGQNVYATFATARPSALGGVVDAEEGNSVLVARSADGGRTFGTAVVALAGGPSPTTGPDYALPKLAVERGAGAGGADRIYLVAGSAEGSAAQAAAVSVSNDGGQTWSEPVNASAEGESAREQSQPVVGPDGAVSVAWRGSNSVVVARSTDQGKTWTRTNAAGVSGSLFPRLAADGRSGNLYLVYGQGTAPTPPPEGFAAADHFIHADMDVYFQRSTNNGAAWSTPKLINDATPRPGSEVTQTRHPEVAVAPNGRVDIVWQDRRHWYRGCTDTHNRCAEARLGDTYYAYSTDSGSSFSRDRRITDRHHNNDVGFDYRFGTYWDFGPVLAHLGNDQLLVGWMDSRRGSFESDNQDIYLAKVNHKGPGRVAQQSLNRPDDTALSVALSRLAYPGGGESLLEATFATRAATRVVIVNERDGAGALAGAVLARANLGPILLSPASGLPETVADEISRLDAIGAYVIGNEGSLSAQVVTDLAAAGVPADQIQRLVGPGNPGNAEAIAQALDRRSQADRDAGTPAFDAAIIANPASPDAAAAAGLAAARRLPVLFVGADSIPVGTTNALASLGLKTTLVVGGPRWVSDGVMGQLPSPKRLGGSDQYATSQAVVAESRERGMPDNIAYVAGGDESLRAALTGSAVGRLGGLLLLSRQNTETTAASTVAGLGLRRVLDRIVLVQPANPISPPITDPDLADKIRPVLSDLRPRPRTFRATKRGPSVAARVGTKVRYRLSELARVRFTVDRAVPGRRAKRGRRCLRPTKANRRAKRCLRFVPLAITRTVPGRRMGGRCVALTRTNSGRKACTRRLRVRPAFVHPGTRGFNTFRFTGRLGGRKLAQGRYRLAARASDPAGNHSRTKRARFRIVRR